MYIYKKKKKTLNFWGNVSETHLTLCLLRETSLICVKIAFLQIQQFIQGNRFVTSNKTKARSHSM